MNKKLKIIIIGLIALVLLLVIIGFIFFPKKNYVADFENELAKENYDGAIIINSNKDSSKSDSCIYLKENKVVIFTLNDNRQVEVAQIIEWPYNKSAEFREKIDALEKYEQDSGNCMKIRNYKSEYYVDMIKLNSIMYEYFMINLNVPIEQMLK